MPPTHCVPNSSMENCTQSPELQILMQGKGNVLEHSQCQKGPLLAEVDANSAHNASATVPSIRGAGHEIAPLQSVLSLHPWHQCL